MSAAADYAADTLRRLDRDRYFATLLLTGPAREALTALYAFNADVATIRDRAREPAAGEVRLQWWRDALEGEGHGAVRQNPLAEALLETIASYGLPVPPLVRLLNARRFDLYDDPMPDISSFEGYAGETSSVLFQLGAMILNKGQPVESGDAAGYLGVAQALAGHLRAAGYYAAQGRVFLPWSVLAANGVRENELFAGTKSEGLMEAIGQFEEMAATHLGKAEAAIRNLSRELRPVFAPIAVVRAQLRGFRAESVFQRQADIADWRKIFLLFWWNFRGR